ncbi:Hypothetical predicted protein, partial [Mytilus galloprovincialis]
FAQHHKYKAFNTTTMKFGAIGGDLNKEETLHKVLNMKVYLNKTLAEFLLLYILKLSTNQKKYSVDKAPIIRQIRPYNRNILIDILKAPPFEEKQTGILKRLSKWGVRLAVRDGSIASINIDIGLFSNEVHGSLH